MSEIWEVVRKMSPSKVLTPPVVFRFCKSAYSPCCFSILQKCLLPPVEFQIYGVDVLCFRANPLANPSTTGQPCLTLREEMDQRKPQGVSTFIKSKNRGSKHF